MINRLKQNKLFKDSFWSLAGNIVGKGAALLAGILVARFLGKEVYGEYGIIRNTVLTIGVFSTFGLGYTATKYIAEFRKLSPEKIPIFIRSANKITIIFSGLMATILFVFADYISIELLDVEHLSLALRILSVLIVFNAITTTQIGVLSGFGKFRVVAKINSIIGVLTFLLSAFLTYFFSLNGALIALLIVQILNTLFNYYEVKKETDLIPKSIQTLDNNLSKEILKFSTPIALQEAVYSITTWLGSLFLIKFATYGDLGMYTAAMQWKAIIIFIPGILRNVILSHLSGNNDNHQAHNKILKQTILINIISTLIPSILVYLFSSIIAQSYGETFVGLENLITLACFSTIFMSISNVYSQAYTSKGLNWVMFRLRLFRDIGVLILAYFLLMRGNLGLNGAYILILSGLIIHCIFMFLMVIFYNMNKNKVYLK